MKLKNRLIMAQLLKVVGMDIVRYFRLRFPNAHWSVWLDKATDRLIEIEGCKRDVAGRVLRSIIQETDAIGKQE